MSAVALPKFVIAVVVLYFVIHPATASKFTIPTLSTYEWGAYDSDLKGLLNPLHHELASDNISPAIAGDQMIDIVQQWLSSHEDFVKSEQECNYKVKAPKTLNAARKAKNALRKKAFARNASTEDRKAFRDAVKAVSFLKNQNKIKQRHKLVTKREKLYRQNFWKFAKQCCSGLLDNEAGIQESPTFSKEVADQYYSARYSSVDPIDLSSASWFSYIPVPQEVTFNLSPIRPKDVKEVLAKKSPTSAPGPDGLMYGLLRKLPSTHHFMATLFTKVLASGEPPESWSKSKVTLIHKAGATTEPSNFRMISLTSCVGKVYHQIMAERTSNFLCNTGVIDNSTQKAFLSGISGCIEHTQVMNELLANARNKKKTIHVTFFDLADAFGSVEHSLIYHTMEACHIPDVVVRYIRNLYSGLQGTVNGPSWQTNPIHFKRGVYQGDPWSPIIFLLAFNPLIAHLKSIEQKHGYDLNGERFITLPFADDFCLITANQRSHQRIINEINLKVKTMNLKLKPEKCRSISICQGSAREVAFKINDDTLATVKDKPEKFLGSYISFYGKSQDNYDIINRKLSDVLQHIDDSQIRNEYKIRVFTEYALPSLRYLLTVHFLTDTQLQLLDGIQSKALKKWLNIPHHGATPAILYSEKGLKFKLVSELYLECHTLAIASTLTKGDPKSSHAVQSKIDREKQWVSKNKTYGVKKSLEIIDRAKGMVIDPNCWHTVRSELKKVIGKDKNLKWKERIDELAKQGNLMKLLEEQSSDLTWKSAMYSLPKGVLSFAARAAIDCLPSPDNLKLWGKSTTDKCSLCNSRATLQHILNMCPKALDQGRLTYRHNSVLRYMVNELKSKAASNGIPVSVYADLPGFRINGGTVPPNVMPTTEKPDIVMNFPGGDDRQVILIELTVPFEPNILKARERKEGRYCQLNNDIKARDIESHLICFEIGSRGVVTKENKKQIKTIFRFVGEKSCKHIVEKLSRLALVGSYVIFNARLDSSWTDMTLLD